MKIAKIFATGISGDIRSEFTVYNVKDVKTIKLTDQCKCYQFLGCEKGKAQAIYLHKTSKGKLDESTRIKRNIK